MEILTTLRTSAHSAMHIVKPGRSVQQVIDRSTNGDVIILLHFVRDCEFLSQGVECRCIETYIKGPRLRWNYE